MRFLGITKSPNPKKKWRATFEKDGRETHTDFGDSAMEDYTQHHDNQRRENYRSRHAKDLKTGDPTRAGFLSYYINWGDYGSIKANTLAYRRKFF